MKKIITIFLSVACIVFLVCPASAYQNKFYGGFNLLYVMENLDDQQTRDKFSGPVDFVDFDDSWGVQLKGGYIFNKLVSVEGRYEFVDAFEVDSNGMTDELDVMNLTVNAKLTCPAFDTYIPYVVAGIGAMSAKEEITFGGATSKTTDNGVCARGGIGVDAYITDEFSIGLEAAYMSGFGNVDHVRYTELSLGVSYHF